MWIGAAGVGSAKPSKPTVRTAPGSLLRTNALCVCGLTRSRCTTQDPGQPAAILLVLQLGGYTLGGDVTTLVAMFTIVNPITSIPVFIALTAGKTTRQRRVVALETAAVSSLTLLVAYFIGHFLLSLLSIDMNAFRIAGALVIGGIAWSMATGKFELDSPEVSAGSSVVPLAIPMMAGPGAIATVIAIGDSNQGIMRVADVVIIVVLGAITFALLSMGEPIARRMGANGLMVMTRIMGLLLLAISVSTIMAGLGRAFPALASY